MKFILTIDLDTGPADYTQLVKILLRLADAADHGKLIVGPLVDVVAGFAKVGEYQIIESDT